MIKWHTTVLIHYYYIMNFDNVKRNFHSLFVELSHFRQKATLVVDSPHTRAAELVVLTKKSGSFCQFALIVNENFVKFSFRLGVGFSGQKS